MEPGSNILEPGSNILEPQNFIFNILERRKSYDKTRFYVSHEGLSNGLGTFGLT